MRLGAPPKAGTGEKIQRDGFPDFALLSKLFGPEYWAGKPGSPLDNIGVLNMPVPGLLSGFFGDLSKSPDRGWLADEPGGADSRFSRVRCRMQSRSAAGQGDNRSR